MRTRKLATKVTLATASLALLSATPAVAVAAETSTHNQTAPVRAAGSHLVKTYSRSISCYAAIAAHAASGADGSMSCRKIYYAKPDVTNWQLWLTV